VSDLTAHHRDAALTAKIGKLVSLVAILVLILVDAPHVFAAAFSVVWAMFACTEIICAALNQKDEG